jgi:hypothetical protein
VLAAHTASFLNLINTALEDISRGVASPHHFQFQSGSRARACARSKNYAYQN